MLIDIFKKLIKKKYKKIIFLIYLILFFSIPMYLYFTGFYALLELNNLSIIHNKMVIDLKYDQTIILFLFFLFNIFWTFFIGVNTPLNIIAGFLFGNFNGLSIILISSTLGSILFYSFFSFLTKNQLRTLIPKKYDNVMVNLKKNEIFYFSILRLSFFIPQILCNLLPLFTRMRLITFSVITFFMTIPIRAFTVNIGDKIFLQYQNANFQNNFLEIKLIYSIFILVIFLIGSYIIHNKYFIVKKNNK